jgi:hypothetical protein
MWNEKRMKFPGYWVICVSLDHSENQLQHMLDYSHIHAMPT